MKPRFFLILGTLVLLAALAVLLWPVLFPPEQPDPGLEEGAGEQTPPPDEVVTLDILCVGDVMVHKPQIASQYDEATGTYDYTNNFQYVKKYIEAADLAICNVETTFAGGEPSGYPSFNAPDALADALVWAGFDVGITSNNHMIDKGHKGLIRTLQVLRNAGLATTGSRLEWEKDYTIMDVDGVQVAVIAATYETAMRGTQHTINGIGVSKASEPLINMFRYGSLDEDLAKMQTRINNAKADGADIIVCYYHWGEEYQTSPNEWQQTIAQRTVDMGADIIFASHPHVPQGVEYLQNAEGRQVPVFYSLGNFISNQRRETLGGDKYIPTEQDLMGRVTVTYNKTQGRVESAEMDVIGAWVDKYYQGGKTVYAVVPLDKDLESNPALQASGHLERAKAALEDIKKTVGEEYVSAE
ncbi:MAG: CapA family protein [Firmicutes bacterium]|nr:CapA family protein [Bacillota bacterium]